MRTTLLCRTEEQARELDEKRENEKYLSGVELPERLKIRVLGGVEDQFDRADLIFVAVPSAGLPGALDELSARASRRAPGSCRWPRGCCRRTARRRRWRSSARSASSASPASAGPRTRKEMVESGAGLVCASHSQALAERVADLFHRAGVMCEASDDPVGVELAGCAKNAAALAAGATESQGLNAAGMAAADIFTEVLALAERNGATRAHVRRPRGHGRPGRDRARAAVAQPQRRRAAGPGRARRRRSPTGSARRSRRSRPCRCSRARSSRPA